MLIIISVHHFFLIRKLPCEPSMPFYPLVISIFFILHSLLSHSSASKQLLFCLVTLRYNKALMRLCVMFVIFSHFNCNHLCSPWWQCVFLLNGLWYKFCFDSYEWLRIFVWLNMLWGRDVTLNFSCVWKIYKITHHLF